MAEAVIIASFGELTPKAQPCPIDVWLAAWVAVCHLPPQWNGFAGKRGQRFPEPYICWGDGGIHHISTCGAGRISRNKYLESDHNDRFMESVWRLWC